MVAKLGSRHPGLNITEFGTQLLEIDNMDLVPYSNMTLLHLSENATSTSSVRPIVIPVIFDVDPKRDLCVTMIQEKSVFLRPRDECSSRFRCYARTESSGSCDPRPWIGVIACQSRLGWHPSSVFSSSNGECGLEDASFFSLESSLHYLHSAIGKKSKISAMCLLKFYRGNCARPIDLLCFFFSNRITGHVHKGTKPKLIFYLERRIFNFNIKGP